MLLMLLVVCGVVATCVVDTTTHTLQVPPAAISPLGRKTIEFEYHNGVMFVRGTIGDSEPLTILLDTGANAPALDDDVAKELDLESAGRVTVVGTAGERQVESVHIAELKIGDQTLRDLKATVYDLSGITTPGGHSVSAIVGRNFFDTFMVEIDFPTRSMTIVDERPEEDCPSIPIEMESGIPRLRANLSVDGKQSCELELRLDTGASIATSDTIVVNVPEHDFETLRKQHPMLEQIGQATAQGVGGEVTLRLYRAAALTVAGRVFKSPTIIVQPAVGYFAKDDAVGFVSNNLLEKFERICIDYPKKKIWLLENPQRESIDQGPGAAFDLTRDSSGPVDK